MTKSRPCASFLRPARLCRFLLLLGAIKLCLLGTLLVDPLARLFPPRSSETGDLADSGIRPSPALNDGASVSFGLSLAQAAPAAPAAAAPVPADAAASDPAANPAGMPGASPLSSPVVSDQSSSLVREALARKEQEISRREQDLQTLERELDDRLERLQLLETRLTVMLKDANEVKEEKFRRLVDMLGNMKARQAASVLETIEETTAVKVLAGMRGRQSGEILTYVNPTKAARLAEALTRMQLPFE